MKNEKEKETVLISIFRPIPLYKIVGLKTVLYN